MYLANSNFIFADITNINRYLFSLSLQILLLFELINLHYYRYWYLVGIIINITLIIKHIFNSNNKRSIIIFLHYICWYSYIRFSATLVTNTLASFILPTNFLLQVFLSPITSIVSIKIESEIYCISRDLTRLSFCFQVSIILEVTIIVGVEEVLRLVSVFLKLIATSIVDKMRIWEEIALDKDSCYQNSLKVSFLRQLFWTAVEILLNLFLIYLTLV